MTQVFAQFKRITLGALALSLLVPCAFAAPKKTATKAPDEKPELNIADGIILGKKTDPFWFKVSGAMQLDQRQFMGKGKTNAFNSGANLRKAALSFEGGINQDFGYTLALNFKPTGKTVEIDEASVSYLGFGNDTMVGVGQVNPAFSLEGNFSSKWLLLMERSMPVNAFAARSGLGVTGNKFANNYSLAASLTQPGMGDEVYDRYKNKANSRDRLNLSARGTYAWHFGNSKIFQLGMSGYFQDDNNNLVSFSTNPEASARNITDTLDTGEKNTAMAAKNHKCVALEASNQWGPLYAQAEWINTFVRRSTTLTGQKRSSLRFSGYHAQVAYVLTGESRQFNSGNGTFTRVIPASPKGAWELAARYSFVNLNRADIRGGMAHNLMGGVNYYVNRNIKMTGEYGYSRQHTGTASEKFSKQDARRLQTLGLRLQVIF